MNVFVTGHTSGLGKAIYDTCISYDYHTVGLSRSNGFDLAKNLENFIQRDYWDVFVNNAYHSWAQTDLLYKLFEKNKVSPSVCKKGDFSFSLLLIFAPRFLGEVHLPSTL